jgi:hypothetical protein
MMTGPRDFLGGSDCSALLIGDTTAVSAAHCFWAVNETDWKAPGAWAVGAVFSMNTLTGQPVASYRLGPWNGCEVVSIPAGWAAVDGNGSRHFDVWDDFAVIEFSTAETGCNLVEPGDTPTTSHAWSAIGSASDYWQNPANLKAYDAIAPFPATRIVVNQKYSGSTPSLLTRYAAGPGVVSLPSDSRLLWHTLDITHGSSGGGLLQPVFASAGDPTWYFVGANAQSGLGVGPNIARRLDWPMWAFIQDSSREY